jgi:hypothetical protein
MKRAVSKVKFSGKLQVWKASLMGSFQHLSLSGLQPRTTKKNKSDQQLM